MLRRPGIYGRDEMAERLVLEAMAAVDGSLVRWHAECDGLRERRAFSVTGVRGAYSNILPAGALRNAVASVYAGIAHRCGWLDLDRVLSDREYRRMATQVGEWIVEDRTLSSVLATFDSPSLWIGGTSGFYPKALAYATADPGDDLIVVHAWNSLAVGAGAEVPGVYPEPAVLAVQHRAGDFPSSFSFTPEGLRRRPRADQPSPIRRTVWVFHGDRARYASAVFETAEAGLAWAAGHRVTGVLAEYPDGGAYDAAVAEGRFTPSQPHHGTAGHVAGFGPGLQHHHLTDGHRD